MILLVLIVVITRLRSISILLEYMLLIVILHFPFLVYVSSYNVHSHS